MSLRQNIKHLALHRSFLRYLSTLSSPAPPPPPPEPSRHLTNPQVDPYPLLKQDPLEICSSIWVKTFSSPPNTPFPNLTGFISKLDLWVLAYQRSCAHFTGALPPRTAIHSHVLQALLSLRDAVVHCQFKWNDKAQPFIYGPNDKPLVKLTSKRKLQAYLDSDAECFQDRVVQEVLLMVLEPVFEARFSTKSHAFRPGRNAHTVIRTIRGSFAGYLWLLKGDLSAIFEYLDENVVMSCLEKAVKDRKVLNLIKLALRGTVKVKEEGKVEKKIRREKKTKKLKKKKKKKTILNPNEPKPDPYWLRTFFSFAPEEADKEESLQKLGDVFAKSLETELMSIYCCNWFVMPQLYDIYWKQTIGERVAFQNFTNFLVTDNFALEESLEIFGDVFASSWQSEPKFIHCSNWSNWYRQGLKHGYRLLLKLMLFRWLLVLEAEKTKP